MKKIAIVAASILFAFAAIAAGTSDSKSTASAEYDGPTSMVKNTPAPEHDYKLERESCCGPQS